jgi:hypothetical protein
MAVLDYANGTRLATVANVPSDVPIVNTQTDRIVLASGTGLVQCFRETGLPFPLVHYQIEPQKKAAKPVLKAPGQKSEEKAVPAEGDPFAPGAKPATPAADPFADPAAKPAAPPAAGDPFATP